MRQASLEAKVRYGPELEGIRALVREAQGDLKRNVAAEEGAAEGIKAAAKAARPRLQGVYGDARRTYSESDQDVANTFRGLGGASDEARGVAARERSNMAKRLEESLAGADTELSQRQVDAEAGRAYAVRNHAANYAKDKAKLDDRRKSLAGEIGAFKIATARDLSEAARKAEMDEAQFQLAVARENRQAAEGQARLRQGDKRIRQGDARLRMDRQKSRGEKRKTDKSALKTHQRIVGDIQDAASVARRIAESDTSLKASDVVDLMTLPKSIAPSGRNPSGKNPYGGFGPYTARAAVSLVFNGQLAPHLVRGLRSRGFLPHRMTRWLPKRGRKHTAPGRIPGRGISGRDLHLNPFG